MIMELSSEHYLQSSIVLTKQMLVYGIFAFILSIVFYQGIAPITKGISIPLFLIAILFIVYSTFSWISHTKELSRKSQVSDFNKMYRTHEVLKMKGNIQSYSMVIKLWTILLILSPFGFLSVKSGFSKGLFIGAGIFFLSTLLADIHLRKIASRYLVQLEKQIDMHGNMS